MGCVNSQNQCIIVNLGVVCGLRWEEERQVQKICNSITDVAVHLKH